MDLTDKVALITGGRRIGIVVAAELAARGGDVVLSYARSKDEAERTADAVRTAGRRAASIAADLSRPADCRSLVDAAAGKFGRRLSQDEAAVRSGLGLGWSNGPVEGHVNRLKVIKRSMFGRARFDLLRARVLAAG
jgi:transposase